MKFIDMTTDARLNIRRTIENLTGAEVAGYCGAAIQSPRYRTARSGNR